MSTSRLHQLVGCKEVRFSSFLSGGFTTMAVINRPESKLTKGTSVGCLTYKHTAPKSFRIGLKTISMDCTE
jgi:hypothetical protein